MAVHTLHNRGLRASSILIAAGHPLNNMGYLLHCDLEGRELGIYWIWGHPGRSLVEIDMDGNGEMEVLVGVRNDSFGGPMLLLFDGKRFDGFAPCERSIELFPESPVRGSHLPCILFPRSDITTQEYKNYIEAITYFEESDRIGVAVNEGSLPPKQGILWYSFDRFLSPVGFDFTDEFRQAREHCLKDGDVSSELDETYCENLTAMLRYHDGSGWTSTPPAR